MNRRTFFRTSATLAAAMTLPRRLCAEGKSFARQLAARVVSAPEIPLPTGKREPFGWKTVAISEVPLVLAWPDFPANAKPTALRLAVGLDVRDEKLIEAVLPTTGRVLGTFDVRYACIFQVFEIPLTPADATDIRREGIALRLTKGTELRVFTEGDAMPAALQPHLLMPGAADAMAEYFARMDSLACVQSFSWQGGCVLDGLLDLAAVPAHAHLKEAARRQLARFIIGGKLVYENHVSAISDGRIYGIEGTLPFAALAKLEPQSPLLELALASWAKSTTPRTPSSTGSTRPAKAHTRSATRSPSSRDCAKTMR